jgi:hypothetical protein
MSIEIGEIYKTVLIDLGVRAEDVPSIVADINRYYDNRLTTYKISGGKGDIEGIKNFFSDPSGVVVEIIKDYWRFCDYKKEIAETYQESKSWLKVFSTHVYSDVKEAQESFIDYVEETYQTKIKDAKHLQKLTGITHLDSWDEKACKYITPDTDEEAKENAIRELEETLINSKYSKYFRALETALKTGVKYKDLLQIKPQDYGLPKTWSGCLSSDQYSSILWALSYEFLINEPASLMLLPDLRSIAEEIEAPYSVLMDCYNLTNKGKKYGATGD